MWNGGSSAAARTWTLRVIAAFAIILTSSGPSSPRAFAAGEGDKAAAAPASRRTPAKFLSAPLSFEPNLGQADPAVQFLSRGPGFSLFLAPGETALSLERHKPAPPAGQTPEPASADTVRMRLLGANPRPKAAGLVPQGGVVSYFMGNDPRKWRTGIPTYGKVEYQQVYPGVDLVFYGNQRRLEYDFVVAPGADPNPIAWRIRGARPAIDPEGNLALRAPHGLATFLKPTAYQLDGVRKTEVAGAFVVSGDQVRFRLGP